MEEKISIDIALSVLVESNSKGKVGEKIDLKLIEGLKPSEILWRYNNIDVRVSEDSTVVFSTPGFYIPIIHGYPQHSKYGIYVE